MAYIVSQTDIQTIQQHEKEVYVKIDLLNKKFQTIDSLTGNLISDNLNVSSESKQRRTYSCDLVLTDASFLIGYDKKIWIDKYIRPYYGIKNIRSGEIVWWKIGVFTYNDVNYTYSGTEKQLSLSCIDLMGDYDGTKNGQISGYDLKIPAGEKIYSTIIALMNSAGIEKYNIENTDLEIPYDLEFTDSTTYCDIWTQIAELYDSWEFFFDVDGVFIWRKVPTGLSEQCICDDTLLSPIIISESTQNSFSGIYYVTEVWGRTIELENEDRYTENSTYDSTNNIYHITLENVSSLNDIDHLDKIGFKVCETCQAGAKVSINNLEAIPIIDGETSSDSPIAAGRLLKDTTYVFMYRRNIGETIANCLSLMGQYQAHSVYEETNIECPFSTTRLGYKIVNRVNYDSLYSDNLCYNQAEYLTYQSTAMRDTITLSLFIIPWMEVGQKIKYTSKTTGETNQYIVKDFSWSSLDGTMSLTLYKFLESFSYVYNRKNQKGR